MREREEYRKSCKTRCIEEAEMAKEILIMVDARFKRRRLNPSSQVISLIQI